ncbi:phosphoglucosamine mutase [Brevibacterium sanguinis]|uniref:Phosphoglucosamine mutase n=2 Tax=Brevibacterium TaxID=1696 RepID=A0A366INH6_9MICO|nr:MULTISPECIES: phosphoglucosamine mutase [Brevibacterium]RBP68184.1 phosphoglucosamine mutase [Brevibacterium sanguinis]RBP74399.1 phosphoglucosamine mutase [Brevibacterium celere]
MTRLFGTDGVRGLANRDITAKLALQLSVAATRILSRQWTGDKRPFAVVGRDTRVSGEFLSAAISAGIASAGVDVLDAGMLPTPGVARVVKDTGAAFGVVISASHNPMPDNGIKFFAAGGTKLDDAVEDEILEILDADWDRPTGADVGSISRYPAAADEYTEHLVRSIAGEPRRPLSGLKVVVDCAHGAASVVGPAALRQAGAEVIVTAAEPNGLNINDGVGSTHLEPLQRLVVETQSDLGVAFDGDADRCLAVDALGRVVNGDQLMGILAIGLKELGELKNDTLVTTVMSNLGLKLAMDKYSIRTVQTAVGDRYVLEGMLAGGFVLGGEQSGHVLMLDHGTTGDGVQTALHLMKRMADSKRTLADLAAEIPQLPQALVNVSGVDKHRVDHPTVAAEVDAVETELAGTGRVLLRASGTEPLIRVMVEAETEDAAQAQAARLARTVKTHLAL